MPSPIAAANAYASLARLTGGVQTHASAALPAPKGTGANFGALLENALTQVAAKGREADSRALSLAAGKADLVDVVTAVAETEVAVETLVSVRDKVIQAYEEIFRMPI